MIQVDLGLREKRKAAKELKRSRKKKKVVRDHPVRFTNDEYNLLEDRMVEISDETHQNIDN